MAWPGTIEDPTPVHDGMPRVRVTYDEIDGTQSFIPYEPVTGGNPVPTTGQLWPRGDNA